MLNKICSRLFRITNIQAIPRLAHSQNQIVEHVASERFDVIDTRSLPKDDFLDVQVEQKSVLEDCTEDISHVAPYLKPTFNFAAYVNKSQTLQELVKLGVNLHKLEQSLSVPPYILSLDFDRDIKNHVIFLHNAGLNVEQIGTTITKNPYIFKQDLDTLQVRINYLLAKKFTNDMIVRILNRNPFWLMFTTHRIDERLGFFQQEFSLTGDEVRSLTIRQPRLITYSMKKIKLNTFVIKEEMGFLPEEVKSILLNKPNLFMKEQNKMLKTFEYIHRTMQIPLELIAKLPEVLTCREFRVKQRHLFLTMLGKAQYDPKEPNYVSVLTVVSGSDEDFCTNIAKTSIEAFDIFVKSL